MTPKRLKDFGKTPDSLCALLTMLSAGGFAWAQKNIYKQAPSFVYEQDGLYKSTWAQKNIYKQAPSFRVQAGWSLQKHAAVGARQLSNEVCLSRFL
jgi:hypothetical protein